MIATETRCPLAGQARRASFLLIGLEKHKYVQ